jgi:hypothetical protein
MPSLQVVLRRAILGALAAASSAIVPGAALAVVGTPPTAVCTGPCNACLESEVAPNGEKRCVKCGVDPNCSADPGLASENTEILKAHNGYRATHGTPALTWSKDLALGAQQWASACTSNGQGGFAHSPNAFSQYGENLRWGKGAGFTGPQSAVASWYNEIKNYKFDDPITSYKAGDTDHSKEVRHFTQVIWRDTKQVGCGVAQCNGYEYWVCRYSPPGNWNGDKPGVLQSQVPPAGGIKTTESKGSGGGVKTQSTPPVTTGGGGQPARGDWSSFASNGSGNWGYATYYATQADAQNLAVNGCGGAGKGCKAFWTTNAKCVAYAESRQGGYWYAAGGANDANQANQNALKFCQSGSAPPGSCKVTLSKCH